MPTFTHTLPSDSEHEGYRLVRTPTLSKLTAHVVSDRLTGCFTHFTNNRTIPCERPNCKSCDSGITSRWHAYLLILLDATQELVIFEITKRAAAAFDAYHQHHSTLRGCHFAASRLHHKPNGRVMIQTKTGDMSRINLPQEKDLEKLLCHIWNIPPLQTDVKLATPADPIDRIHVDRTKQELHASRDSAPPIAQAIALTQQTANGNGEQPAA